MLEMFLAFVLIAGCVRAVGLRHTWALVGGGTVLYLLVADVLCSIGSGAQGGVFGFFGEAFVGLGASPFRSVGALPMPRVFIAHPLFTRALRCVICWLVAWICLRQSSRLNPLLPRAYALDDVASAFVGAGIVDAIAAVVLLWAWLMIGDDAAWLPRG
jgi:hypothetical protein